MQAQFAPAQSSTSDLESVGLGLIPGGRVSNFFLLGPEAPSSGFDSVLVVFVRIFCVEIVQRKHFERSFEPARASPCPSLLLFE